MPHSTATSTAVAGPAYGLDLGEVNSMLSGHREFLSKTKGRGSQLGSPERDRPGRWNAYSHGTTSNDSLASPLVADSPAGPQDEPANEDTMADARPQLRPWKTEHRISVGPEKAWSIGSGETANDADGQVEKSITEVLAGVEPNARSRKASHSLRFFKEGLPEEKGKRKDHRVAQPPRDKSPARGEKLAGIEEQPIGEEEITAHGLDDKAVSTKGPDWARAIPIRTPEIRTSQALAKDLFGPKHGDSGMRDAVPEPTLFRHKAGDSAEEGEESGEEKISSAVFLPHQAPEQAEEDSPVVGVPQRAVPARRESRNGDFHPWLVKADGPESEDKQEIVDEEKRIRPEAAQSPSVAPEVAFRQVDESAPVDESAAAVLPSPLSRPLPQYHGEAIHEHQLAPKQPLDAIELIPYKHQVGGHTTIWRFSRRAVCKQLNNRENEFYEKIEKYHRDLLAFLPRYIGVLNVTFQKQPRRKSTMRRDDTGAPERAQAALNGPHANPKSNGPAQGGTPQQSLEAQSAEPRPRMISQSLQFSARGPVPTVTFVDNQHILPRYLLQPTGSSPGSSGRYRSSSGSMRGAGPGGPDEWTGSQNGPSRPSLHDRHAHSWGATTVNKRLRNEVFNDAFLKQPVAIHRHRKGRQRPVAWRSLPHVLRPSGSDPTLVESHEKRSQAVDIAEKPARANGSPHPSRLSHLHTQSDLGQTQGVCEGDETAPADVTGTSAPEPEILGDSSPAPAPQMKKRRFSGTGLRRKPKDVQEGRGDLQYFEEADEVGYKGDPEAATPVETPTPSSPPHAELPAEGGGRPTEAPQDFSMIPRPINPKEAQTQRDSRVEYFLLLEDLTAGMKRPCIMDLKMGTRQYGVDASPAKQKSQQGKCAKTTSRELGVRVCGLQVWDVQTQSYVFKDKYYGRSLKKGAEFQGALTRFLYDGVDRASILRHIPTVLQKLDELEVIIVRLRGYRFYAASLLMFYDGDDAAAAGHYVDDSTTDFATDTEDAPRRARRNPREIDFKMADFANCVTAGDLARDRPCPPRHPEEPDRGFLRGLRSLRRYFLRIQRDTRREMGLVGGMRNGAGESVCEAGEEAEEEEEEEEEGSVSE
ncbi:SAICAR synthase-like protein [Trichocladium antarcticum]|uniref:Kinase n=1 Tax=Trichocladium antarcticum TaxID=1450529 RepID=A0AAN6UC94_9PEZI|nr:SAICAR synthase-like protein [Trichocladium antarcticum]